LKVGEKYQQRAVYIMLPASNEAYTPSYTAPTDYVTTVAAGVLAKGTLFISILRGWLAPGESFLFITRTIMYLFSHVAEDDAFQPVAVLPCPWPPKVLQPRVAVLYCPAVGLPKPKSCRCITCSGVSPVTVVDAARSSAQSDESIPDQNLFQSSHTIAGYFVIVYVRAAPV
jgi:hypothetical protein